MWKEFNPNPCGIRVGDCAIRAICAAEDLSWYEAYDDLVHYGRRLCNLPNANEVWGAYLKDKGYTRHVIENTCPACYTVRDFCRDHSDGIYVLGTGSHVVTVIFGDYLDAWDSGSEAPVYYWRADL
jgi:hypothetical protein